MSDVTQILSRIDSGEQRAAHELLPLVYDELRQLAAATMAKERPGQTLQATALVHEAYVRLVRGRDEQLWNSRGHFFAAAAESMRRILIERARHEKRVKHGGDRTRVDLDSGCLVGGPTPVDLLDLDAALTRLETEQPAKAAVVKLRYFAGLTTAEAAQALGISLATAERHLAFARGWLYAELAEPSAGGEKNLEVE